MAIDADSLAELVIGLRIVNSLRVRQKVTSTNDVARELAVTDEADGTVVVADRQTHGRGRRGRSWSSPAGAGIYLSCVFQPLRPAPTYAAALQLGAGLAVAETLRPYVPTMPELRWPNDCYVSGRKAAGILVEAEGFGSEVSTLICGVGINVDQETEDFPPQIRSVAGSIRSLGGHSPPRETVISELLVHLDYWEGRARAGGVSAVKQAWLAASPMASGAIVELDLGNEQLHGCTVGLDDSGALLVESGGRVRAIHAGRLVRLFTVET